jgi:hypothetical protein
MRFLILLAFLLFSPTSLGEVIFTPDSLTEVNTPNITVLQINTAWNKHHDIDLNGLIGCNVKYGLLERQNKDLKSQIQYVPVIVIYKNNKPVKQWSADLSFKLDVDVNEIQQVIDRL